MTSLQTDLYNIMGVFMLLSVITPLTSSTTKYRGPQLPLERDLAALYAGWRAQISSRHKETDIKALWSIPSLEAESVCTNATEEAVDWCEDRQGQSMERAAYACCGIQDCIIKNSNSRPQLMGCYRHQQYCKSLSCCLHACGGSSSSNTRISG